MPHRTLSDEPIAPAKLAHVVLRTARYEQSKAWYLSVLAARVVFDSPFIAFLTYDGEHHRLAVINCEGAPVPPPGATGIDHVAFTFASVGELLSTYRRLRGEGIEPYWAINHGPTTSLYYRDPDGNQIELQVDNFDSDEDFEAWVATGQFAENPIGVEFDPDALCDRYLDGEDEVSLRRQEVLR